MVNWNPLVTISHPLEGPGNCHDWCTFSDLLVCFLKWYNIDVHLVEAKQEVLILPGSQSETKLCSMVGSGILNPWIIPKTMISLVLDSQGNAKLLLRWTKHVEHIFFLEVLWKERNTFNIPWTELSGFWSILSFDHFIYAYMLIFSSQGENAGPSVWAFSRKTSRKTELWENLAATTNTFVTWIPLKNLWYRFQSPGSSSFCC